MSEPLRELKRWEDSGATWRILVHTGDEVEIALLSCDAGEEMGRIRTTEPDVLHHVERADSDGP